MLPIIEKECMLFDIDVQSKDEAIVAMIEAFDKAGYLNDKDTYYKDVLAREEVFSTYIGYGIGLPHGKSDGVEESGICVARLNNEIVWNDETGDTINFIIMIAVRIKSDSNLHLQILSKLSRLLMHEDFRDRIMNGDVQEVFRVLEKELEV